MGQIMAEALVSRQCFDCTQDPETHDQFLAWKLGRSTRDRVVKDSRQGKKRLLELDVRSILETYNVASFLAASFE